MQYTISNADFRAAHESTVFPDSRTFTRHAHPEYELLYFISGEADCIVDYLRHTLHPGELALIPPMSYHLISLTGKETYERIVIDFAGGELPAPILNRVFSEPRVLNAQEIPEISSVLTRLDLYAHRFSQETASLLARNLTTELVCLIDTAEPQVHHFSGFNRTMEEAMLYIDTHIDCITGIDELCSHLYISRAYLHRLFQNTLGITPMRFIMDKRLLLAQSRLKLGEKPTQVCSACGFGDYSAFYRAYKAYFGISPGEENPKRKNSKEP